MSILNRIGLRGLSLRGLIACCLISGIIACGTTNNDQGTSFLALGFFDTGDGDAGDSGTVVYQNQDIAGQQGVFPLFVPIDKDPTTPELEGGFIGLQNRLTAQYVRTVRMDCCYEVPGADSSLVIPCDAYNFTAVIPAACDTCESTSDLCGEGASCAFVQVQQVSPDMLAFLSVNQNLLPQLPYRMTAECTVTGVSQAGDVFVTNTVNYQIQFAELPEPFNGGPGSITGGVPAGDAGTGGDIDTFGDEDPEEAVVGEGGAGFPDAAAGGDTGG